MKKVAMIGVGKLGQDCAEVMADHYDVVGYDVSPRHPDNFKMCKSIEDAVKDRDFIFIAAPTPHDPMYGGETPTSHLPNKDFDYTIVTDILNEVNKYVNKSQLVVLISTVLPGTVRSLLNPCITNARFIYNPYLIAMGTVKWDMVNPEMVIIGTEDGSITGDARELIEFYTAFMENNPRYEVGTWDEAESIKIFYNTFISTKLALVNMIQDVAEKNGNINVDVVTEALAKSNYRITGPAYMKAGMGDAGACHPRDNIALRYLAEKLNLGYDLFDSIMKAREVQSERMAKTCLEYGNEICILGKAYKPNVPYTNGSCSLLVGHYIEKHGGKVYYYDPHTMDLEHHPGKPFDVFLIGYWEKWLEEFFEKGNVNHRAVVIDPWRRVTSSMFGGSIVHYGNPLYGKKKVDDIEQQNFRLYTFTLWPELAKEVDQIYFVKANPTLISKHAVLLAKEINEAIADGKTKIIFYNPSEPILPIDILKIHQALPKININPSKIYYLTATLNAEEVYEKLCQEHGLSDRINVQYLGAMFHNLQSINYKVEEPKFVIENKPKKFLCFNKSLRLHRIALIARLIQQNLLNSGYCSTYTNDTEWIDYHRMGTLNLINPTLKKTITDNRHLFPLKIDNYDVLRSNPIDLADTDRQYYNDTYYSLVTETLFFKENIDKLTSDYPYAHSITFTEKTFKPMAMKHPFILMAPANSLKALRLLGYKTYAPYINESYDDELDDNKRLELIVNEVDRLNALTPEQWLDWQKNVQSTVEHNFSVFVNTRKYRVNIDTWLQ